MQDIPVFTTENGVASLVLKEIPYREKAYIRLQSTQSPQLLIDECRSFCRAAGANHIYASGHEILEAYPFHTSILEMRGHTAHFPETNAALFPVTEKKLIDWCELYNQKMQDVANAAYMAKTDATQLLKRGDGYFVHMAGKLLGIGIASGNRIDAVAAIEPGTGREVVSALSRALSADEVLVEVASVNERAIRLYRSLGFICVREISRWYKIF